MFKMNQIKMNLVTDTSGGQGAAPQVPPTTTTPQAQGIGETSALTAMYPTQVTQAAPEAGKEQPTQKAVPTEEVKSGTAGYAEPTAGTGAGYAEPKAAEVVPPVVPPTATTDEIKFDETGMSPELVTTIKDFAKANNLSKEAVEAFAKYNKAQVDMVKTYEANQAKAIEAARTKQRSDWYNELKSDKDFGGEHFNTNLKRIDTMIEKFFPSTKNMLTDRNGMLPPSLMKDLHGLHKVLLGADPVVNPGGNGAGPSDDQSFLKSFYGL